MAGEANKAAQARTPAFGDVYASIVSVTPIEVDAKSIALFTGKTKDTDRVSTSLYSKYVAEGFRKRHFRLRAT